MIANFKLDVLTSINLKNYNKMYHTMTDDTHGYNINGEAMYRQVWGAPAPSPYLEKLGNDFFFFFT
jgi:hypothetical protein